MKSIDDLARERYEAYCRRNGVTITAWEMLSAEFRAQFQPPPDKRQLDLFTSVVEQPIAQRRLL